MPHTHPFLTLTQHPHSHLQAIHSHLPKAISQIVTTYSPNITFSGDLHRYIPVHYPEVRKVNFMKSYFYLQTKFSSLTVLQTNESFWLNNLSLSKHSKLSMSNVMKELRPRILKWPPPSQNSFKLERLSFILDATDICVLLLSVSQFEETFVSRFQNMQT